MPTGKTCPTCGKSIADNSLMGLCPECLLRAGIGTVDSEGEMGRKSASFVPPTVEELTRYFPELEIIELLGHGGMGAVYKARQRRLERLVALKILPPDVGQAPSFAERFEREAKALAQLHHPNIVTLYDSGRTDGLFYFFMEFVDGVNLRQLLDAGHVSPQEALAIVPQICDALQFAHDRGIIHRDIKPENILLNREGQVKIADFGVAKIVAHESSETGLSASLWETGETEGGKVIGTRAYMAPEQLSSPREVDSRCDIYALGVVFYQMLTGELPAGKFQPPSRKVQIDVRLDEVVLRALEKKPELRYQHASALKTEVETIAGAPKNKSARPRTRTLALAAGLAGAIVLLGSLGVMVLIRMAHHESAQVKGGKTPNLLTDAHREVVEAELRQAKTIAAQEEREYQAGMLTVSPLEFQAAQDKVGILEAELTGDTVQIAKARLLAAQQQLKIASNLYKAGLLPDPLEYQKAQGDVAIAEAQLREVDPKAEALKAMPQAAINIVPVTSTTPYVGDIGVYINSLGSVLPPNKPSATISNYERSDSVPVTFTIPEDDVQSVVKKLDAKQTLKLEAYSRDMKSEIGKGFLVGVDNQIDMNTGLLTCKGAVTANGDTILFPNMFLNVRLLLETKHGVILLPVKAIQYGNQGTFVYTLKTDHTVAIRHIEVGVIEGEIAEIKKGLSSGETVVATIPADLQEGSTVREEPEKKTDEKANPL